AFHEGSKLLFYGGSFSLGSLIRRFGGHAGAWAQFAKENCRSMTAESSVLSQRDGAFAGGALSFYRFHCREAAEHSSQTSWVHVFSRSSSSRHISTALANSMVSPASL